MSHSLVFATTNQGKLSELRALLGPSWIVKSAADFPHLPEVEEDRDTFEGNAAKKAHAFAQALGLWALADDSGLCVDALHGGPGVFSARYGVSDDARIARLLGELLLVSDAERTARFVCAMALAGPHGEERATRGACEGRIGHQPMGTNGFGYDPIFYLANGRSMAELSKDEKSAISHRGAAFRLIVPQIEALVR